MTATDFGQRFAFADRALPRLLERQAAHHGKAAFVSFPDGPTWSFDAATGIAATYAGALAAVGVAAGDRVALIVSNRAEFLQAFFGCAWLGAVAVPINTASRGLQLRHILENCGARLLVIEAAFLPALDTIALRDVGVETVWLVGGKDEAPRLDLGCDLRAWPGGGDPRPAAAVKPGDTAAIIYTSGTTGPSKGVCCPHANLFWWGANTADLLSLQAGDRLYTTLPLFHVNALNTVYQALLTGSTVIVGRRFSVSGLWPALVESQATVTYLLGAMAPMLLSRPPTPLDRAHKVRIALGPGVPAQFHVPFQERFGFGLVEGYGSTETNFVIGAKPGEARPGTMGTVRPGFAARVVDADDTEVADGEAGELVLRADEPFAFSTGYYRMAEKTVEAWRNLWFHTGDRVVRDADGFFRFVDRLKDAIRRRGENISSFEVEQVLSAHPAVAAAAAYPVRSDLAEDEVMAAVVLKDGASLGAAELISFAAPNLPYYAVPRYLDFVEALPTTENGKVQKFKLSERGVTPTTFDREAAGIKVR
ncbi:ATP-dependent acyl-CoA ligase [Aurantimonas sp. 22II-16-19i]|uniref:ATP-dependent acyl-CoA ligase n=1 Tax=Aurantimonas sp. 22II-16-19i TaxID=1317114 RepID=UPI0009F7BC59|nr:ATP-dependent acyl-CoA ligase [Aurantimonas sp. 22II-16-19i]ORE97927.1 crotonobetaine/carnitine-CoA ligase [Aurantimonas sp. 22II-16-19i]